MSDVKVKDIETLLSAHPFFKDLDHAQIKFLAGCGKNLHFHKDEIIFHEGREANYFFVIRQGKVVLEINGAQRGAIMIQTVDEGHILGWSWLIPPHKWNFTARALEETSTIILDGACLRKKCQEDHALGYELFKRFSTVLAKRLENTIIQLLDVYGVPVTQRK